MTRASSILAVCAALIAFSCDNSVDPFVESDHLAFAVFGFLDVGADTQFVRIESIRPDGSMERIPERVYTANLDAGDEVEWSDTLVNLDDGSTETVYFAPLRPSPGATYVLVVAARRGAPLRAFTRVPSTPAFDADTTLFLSGEIYQILRWDGIATPSDVRMTYRVAPQLGRAPTLVDLSYDRRFYETTGDEVTITANLSRDIEIVRSKLSDVEEADSVLLYEARSTVRALSDEWNAATDAANIENGEGFFASVGEFTASWTVPDSVARRIGFARP